MRSLRKVKRTCALLTALLLLFCYMIPPQIWAVSMENPENPENTNSEEEQTDPNAISIESVEDLIELSWNCSLDTWSQGRTVALNADLDLTGYSFKPLPTFGGVFEGGGHTITGLKITEDGSEMGFFRYIQKGAVVRDLTISGQVIPGGSAEEIGGIAGVNNGSLQNCVFRGTVRGNSSIGGIAGVNQESGEISGCVSFGTITGKSSAGGISGRNLGVLLKCENGARVNTTSPESVDDNNSGSDEDALNDLLTSSPIEQLTSSTSSEGDASNSSSEQDLLLRGHTDSGGVTGMNSGVIQSCTNTGMVGYPHVGYNIGGIVGRQNGYIDDCINSGTIYGRKDVGGIAGQAEPSLILIPKRELLEDLRTELDKLSNYIDSTLSHADANGNQISNRLLLLGNYTGNARDSSKALLNRVSDFADVNINEINSMSASITNALDTLSPSMNDLSAVADAISVLSDQIREALEILQEADGVENATDAGSRALDMLQSAGDKLSDSVEGIKAAIRSLQNAVIVHNSTAAEQALIDLAVGMQNFSTAFSEFGDACNALDEAIHGGFPHLINEIKAMKDIVAALKRMAGAAEEVNVALRRLAENVDLDLSNAGDALSGLNSPLSDLQGGSRDLNAALSELKSALSSLGSSTEPAKSAIERLQDGANTASTMGQRLESAFQTIQNAVDTLREDGPVTFQTLGEGFQNESTRLYNAFAGLSGEMERLRSDISNTQASLTNDLQAISNQFTVVSNTFLEALDDLERNATREIVEDTSDQNIDAIREGKLSDCQNHGTIEGDRNVGGVVGCMAIDYDLDPEDDAPRIELGNSYETKAVLQNNMNYGAIIAKKDGSGGLVGRMDLGTTIDCQNYGNIESTGGNYVGGIVGWASGTLRRNYSKCVLAGESDVGGIAGWTENMQNCCAITTIERGIERVGSLAGNANLDGLVGNRFVMTETGNAAVDSISYTGLAEPVSFESLQQDPQVPWELTAFTLTFTDGISVIERIPFEYGEDLEFITPPEIPEKEGFYGVWPEFDTSGLQSDLTVEAVYKPWVTLVSSEESAGKLALALAEGQFTEDAVLHVTASQVAPPPVAKNGADVWEVELTGTDLPSADTDNIDDETDETNINIDPDANTKTVPLRLLNRNSGKASVWQLIDGRWQVVEASENGRYVCLEMTGTSGIFCIHSRQSSLPLIAAIFMAAVLVIIFIVRSKKRRHQKNAGIGVKQRKSRPKKQKRSNKIK